MQQVLNLKGEVQVLSVAGKPAGKFLEVFQGAVKPEKPVVLDLSQAEGWRGDDLEDLVRAHHWCREAGGSLTLVRLPKDLVYVLSLLSLDQFFTIESTVEAVVGRRREPMTTMRMIAIQRDQLLAAGSQDPEKAARESVQRVKLCMGYLAPTPERIALLGHLMGLGSAPVDAAAAGQAAGLDGPELENALARLEGLRVLLRGRDGALRFNPGGPTRAAIADILKMWADPGNRDKMREWAAQAAQAAPQAGR